MTHKHGHEHHGHDHEHHHDHDHGHDHDHEHDHLDGLPERITLLNEDGESREFVVCAVVSLDAASYLVLEPAELEEGEEEGVAVFRAEPDDSGELVLHFVDDDEELDLVWEALEQLEDEESEEGDA